MNNVTIVWSVIASCALLLAAMHAIVWLIDRKALANLALACGALSLVVVVILELAMMGALTAHEWGEWLRWAHPPVFVLIVSLLMFFKFHLRTGRSWLIWVIIAMRAVILLLNFTADPNFNYEHIGDVVRAPFLGELVSMPGHAVASSRQWIGTASLLLMVFYMADTLVTLWRTGTRAARRTVVSLGSAMLVSVAAAALLTQLTFYGVVQLPAMISLPFFILICAMAFEMSQDTLRASRLARELRESEARLEFAADSAGLGLWSWDARENRIWSTNRVQAMFELKGNESLTAERLRSLVHVEDFARVLDILKQAAAKRTVQDVRFRVVLPDAGTRWILGRGRSEVDDSGKLISIQGVLRNVTEQFQAQRENDELRRNLTHAERVSVLGRLSSSFAHELSQPLAAILHNAETAQILLKGTNPDLVELRAIIADIQRDDVRAAETIAGMRALFTRREMALVQLSVETLVQGVMSLLRIDASVRHVPLETTIAPGLPAIRGDRVHLSQVLINILINAMDAVANMPESQRRVTLNARNAEPGWVEIEIVDSGPGISDDVMRRIFDPFFTTKSAGMGIGLSVSRTIVDAHNGRLWAENGAAGGAKFRVMLPVFESA